MLEDLPNNFKSFDLLKELCERYPDFTEKLGVWLAEGKVNFFTEEEWNKIKSQNYVPPTKEATDFFDMFRLGYNRGDCVGTSKQLSYSYNDVDIVAGVLPLLKGTLNAEKEGGHCWLETKNNVIDTSLLLIIDKSIKSDLGYIEEQRLTSSQLRKDIFYQSRKDYVNDHGLKSTRAK